MVTEESGSGKERSKRIKIEERMRKFNECFFYRWENQMALNFSEALFKQGHFSIARSDHSLTD